MEGLSPKAKTKRPIGEKILAPVQWVAKSAAWLTNPAGGAKYTLQLASIYCLGLSVESFMVGFPRLTGMEVTRDSEVRFMPKIGINDGADIRRLNPVGLIQAASDASLSWLPFYVKAGVKPYTVWTDPSFYMAVVVAAIIGAVEARMLREVSIKVRKKRLDDVAKHTVPNLDPKALAIAKIRKAELQGAGVGSYAMTGLIVVGAYAIEIGAFFASAAGGFGFAQLIHGLLAVFGFEFAWTIAQQCEKDVLAAED